jgi:gas vesicle protein
MLEGDTVSSDERDSQEGLISLLAGLSVGLLLGGAVALLLAPQTGQQTRSQLRESADDALGRLRESMDELRAKVEEVSANAREAISARRGSEPNALQGGAAGANDEGTAPA